MKEKYKVNQSSTVDRVSRKQKTNRQMEEEKKNDQSIQVLKRKKVVKEREVQNNGGLKQALQAAGFRNVDGWRRYQAKGSGLFYRCSWMLRNQKPLLHKPFTRR